MKDPPFPRGQGLDGDVGRRPSRCFQDAGAAPPPFSGSTAPSAERRAGLGPAAGSPACRCPRPKHQPGPPPTPAPGPSPSPAPRPRQAPATSRSPARRGRAGPGRGSGRETAPAQRPFGPEGGRRGRHRGAVTFLLLSPGAAGSLRAPPARPGCSRGGSSGGRRGAGWREPGKGGEGGGGVRRSPRGPARTPPRPVRRCPGVGA